MALYTVDTLTDESDGDFSAGDLSLREAIEQANANPGTDTIVFASGLAGQNIVLTLGELLILEDVIIDGDIIGSDDVADITLSGDNSSRILNIDDGSATLNALTLTDANVAGVGGALLINSGTSATIANTTIRNSSASEGGGLMNYGTATITNSTISGNIAGGYGGGVSNPGTLSLTNTTLSGNEALEGGGLLNVGTLVARNVTLAGNTASLDGGGLVNTGTASLTNTTLSGNYAGYYGGGLLNSGSATLTHATISANAAGKKGGGLFTDYVGPMEPGVTTLANTIVLGNAASQSDDDRYVGPSATQSLQGVNIVGTTLYGAGAPYALGASAAEAAALVFDATTAAPSAVVSLPDARGGVLTDTGGAVDTILVLRNGFAEDAGSNSFLSESALNQDFDGNAAPGEVGVFLTNDARGLPRTVDVAGRGNDGSNTVDLGAVELQDTPTEAGEALGIITVSGPAPLEELDSGTRFFSFTLTRSGNTDGAGTVDFTVTGTGAEPADAADFGGTLPSGTVTFADGASVATAAIPVSGDMTAEGDESFTLALAEPLGNASLGGASTATATILDDDSNAAPTFDIPRRHSISAPPSR